MRKNGKQTYIKLERTREENSKFESIGQKIMGIPEHPDTIIIQNEFYPDGLKEIQIWNHYKKYKNKILQEVGNRPILLFIFPNLNTPIIKRFHKFAPIRFNKENYDYFITGRTVSISVEQEKNKLNYFCIDVDAGFEISEDDKKKCISEILRVFQDIKLINRTRITVSANSYHVYGYLKKTLKNDEGVHLLRKKFQEDKIIKKNYRISSRVRTNESVINLDLSPMYHRGSHTVPWALNRNGLICMDITRNWKTFQRKDAVVK